MKKLVWILMKQLMDKTGEKWERAVVKSHYGASEADYEGAITSAVSCIHDPANFDQTANRPPPGRQRTLQRSCTTPCAEKGQNSRLCTENPCLSIKPVLITQTLSGQMNSQQIRFDFWFASAEVKHIENETIPSGLTYLPLLAQNYCY